MRGQARGTAAALPLHFEPPTLIVVDGTVKLTTEESVGYIHEQGRHTNEKQCLKCDG